jgi:mono/diheme cytochrome c family protein
MLHSDAEFFDWIKSGKPPTAMPAFGGQLTDDEIWDVVTYVRALGQAETPAS